MTHNQIHNGAKEVAKIIDSLTTKKDNGLIEMNLEGILSKKDIKFISRSSGISLADAGTKYFRLSEEDRNKIRLSREAWEKEQERIKMTEEAIEREKSIAAAYEIFKLSVPSRYRGANIEAVTSDANKAKAAMIGKILQGSSACLAGENSIGKTFMGWALCDEWKKSGESVCFKKALEILSDIKEHISSRENPCTYIREAYGAKIKHLLIDEIDKIRQSDSDFAYFTYLFDIRYDECLQTVIFGNIPDGCRIIDIITQSVYARLKEEGVVYVIKGENKREKNDKNIQMAAV